jgi:hypothetical protein
MVTSPTVPVISPPISPLILPNFPLSLFPTFRLLLVYLSFTCRLPLVYLPCPTSLQPADLPPAH